MNVRSQRITELQCNGDEYSIKDCKHNDWGVTDCEHHEDAGVLCHTERIPGFDIAKLREAQIFDDAEFHIRLQPFPRHKAGFGETIGKTKVQKTPHFQSYFSEVSLLREAVGF